MLLPGTRFAVAPPCIALGTPIMKSNRSKLFLAYGGQPKAREHRGEITYENETVTVGEWTKGGKDSRQEREDVWSKSRNCFSCCQNDWLPNGIKFAESTKSDLPEQLLLASIWMLGVGLVCACVHTCIGGNPWLFSLFSFTFLQLSAFSLFFFCFDSILLDGHLSSLL